ncbi:MFS transporter [Actinomycetospora sp. CA-053990]|uniref:MFS transporter n=1 Tax=Actinomycetospora sp. CA-053990 TaxID=3239891 RepID=UPI003D8B7A31
MSSPSARPSLSGAATSSVVGFLVVLELASGVLQAWLPPLLPSLLERYGVTAGDLNWVSAVFLISTAVCVPLIAKLGDLYGHRRLLVISAALVAAGAVLVAVAPTFGLLLVGRAIQGPLLAFLPLEFAIVRERAGERSGRAVSLLVGALAIGGSVGFLLSGVARQYLSLSVTLWIPAVVMIATVPVTRLLVPETTLRKDGRADLAGAALPGLGLVLFLAAIGNGSRWGWGSALVLVGIVGGLAVLGVWVAVERRVDSPLVDLALVLRGGLGVPLLAGFFFGAELFGGQPATALFLGLPRSSGVGLGLGPGALGAALLTFGVAAFGGTLVAPLVAERWGSRVALVVGSLLTAVGYLLTVVAHASAAGFVAWQVLIGLGNGLVISALSAYVVRRAPADSVGISSGIVNTARTVGGAVAGAVFAAVMAGMVTTVPGAARPVSSEASFVVVWLVCAALALTVAGLSGRLGSRPRGRAW